VLRVPDDGTRVDGEQALELGVLHADTAGAHDDEGRTGAAVRGADALRDDRASPPGGAAWARGATAWRRSTASTVPPAPRSPTSG
jgi:hypothetical protein